VPLIEGKKMSATRTSTRHRHLCPILTSGGRSVARHTLLGPRDLAGQRLCTDSSRQIRLSSTPVTRSTSVWGLVRSRREARGEVEGLDRDKNGLGGGCQCGDYFLRPILSVVLDTCTTTKNEVKRLEYLY
jgi:hypothetical protein